MTSQSRKVFLIGPGFIGAELLEVLIKDGYDVTTMVRRKEAVKPLEDLGAKVIMGTLSDKDIIIEQVVNHPIVIHSATADDLPSVEAVLEGLKARAADGKSTIYIHTSGASVLIDDNASGSKSNQIFDDEKPDQIDALPDDAPHRNVDLAILKAKEQLGNKAKIGIIMPPIIYGLSRQGHTSIQLPTLTRFAIKHGYAGQVGNGLPIWGLVHVSDLARAYATILSWLESDRSDEIHQNPYFFIENGSEISWGEIAKAIGSELHKHGKVESAEPRTIPEDLYSDLFGGFTAKVVSGNARNRANRLRKLGWTPQAKSAEESLRDDEIPLIVKETGAFAGYAKA